MGGEEIESIRIGLCGVGSRTLRASGAEDALTGERPGSEAYSRAGEIAAEECDPIEDAKGSVEYKRDLVRVLLGRTVTRQSSARPGGRYRGADKSKRKRRNARGRGRAAPVARALRKGDPGAYRNPLGV